MDRKYKAEDKVHVHADGKAGPTLATFRQQPYSAYGFDNYKYHGKMYKGFNDNGRVYILLSEPLFEELA